MEQLDGLGEPQEGNIMNAQRGQSYVRKESGPWCPMRKRGQEGRGLERKNRTITLGNEERGHW